MGYAYKDGISSSGSFIPSAAHNSHSRSHRMIPIARPASCILAAFAAAVVRAQADDPVPTLTATPLGLPTTAFGQFIEGAAVNSNGDAFAVDYRAGNQSTSGAFAYFFESGAGTDNVLDLARNPVFVAEQNNDTANPPLLNGARFLADDRVLLVGMSAVLFFSSPLSASACEMEKANVVPCFAITDANNSRVLDVRGSFLNGSSSDEPAVTTFCSNPDMLQPNDLALSVRNFETIYLSGQNFTANTTAGESGDLWTCIGQETIQFPPELLAEADIHRTNGIETSPDGSYLYLSSGENVDFTVVANRIFRFKLDERGRIEEELPELFFDFTGDEAAIDVDGIRTDTDGNLYVTRNGAGQVVKLSPSGELMLVIDLPGNGGPTNVELGGPDGQTLFAVGRCSEAIAGCVNAIELDAVGKAFANLQPDRSAKYRSYRRM